MEAGRPIPAVHLRSDGPFLNNPSLILAVRLGSDDPAPPPPPPPHPAFLSPGPACQPPAPALPARPALVSRPRPLCPRGPACQPLARLPADLIPSVDPRSNGRRSPIPLRQRKLLKETPGFLQNNPPSLEFRS
jgi:hypothetical protein